MQGLRTQESDKFNRFWNIVQETAKIQGMIFYADCGEGRNFETEDMEGEDFWGWLVSIDEAEEFEPDWKKNLVSDEWIDKMIYAEWRYDNGIISVEFNN